MATRAAIYTEQRRDSTEFNELCWQLYSLLAIVSLAIFYQIHIYFHRIIFLYKDYVAFHRY